MPVTRPSPSRQKLYTHSLPTWMMQLLRFGPSCVSSHSTTAQLVQNRAHPKQLLAPCLTLPQALEQSAEPDMGTGQR